MISNWSMLLRSCTRCLNSNKCEPFTASLNWWGWQRMRIWPKKNTTTLSTQRYREITNDQLVIRNYTPKVANIQYSCSRQQKPFKIKVSCRRFLPQSTPLTRRERRAAPAPPDPRIHSGMSSWWTRQTLCGGSGGGRCSPCCCCGGSLWNWKKRGLKGKSFFFFF